MKKIIFYFIVIFFLLTFCYPGKTFAREISSASSAVLANRIVSKAYDKRIEVLGKFLKQYNSPLAQFAAKFVKDADRYNIDWRLVAAIAGVESTFGNFTPNNSYNAWGWGIYGENVTRFSSWEEGIGVISKGIREEYMNKWNAGNVDEIGRIYAASPDWSYRVEWYMERIRDFELNNAKDSLSISI